MDIDGPNSKLSEQLIAALPGMAYRCLNDADWTILEVSQGVEKLTGYLPEEVIGNKKISFYDLICNEDRDQMWQQAKDSLELSGSYELEYRIKHRCGEIYHVSDHGEGVFVDGKLTEMVGYISDNTAKINRLEKLRSFQTSIVQLGRSHNLVGVKFEDYCREIVYEAAKNIGVDRASVWLLSEDKNELRLIWLYESEPQRYSADVTLAAADFPQYFLALLEGRAIDAVDAFSDPRTNEFSSGYLQATGVKSMLDACIRLSGNVVGVVCCEQVGKTRLWDTEDISYAGELADQVAQALANNLQIVAQQEKQNALAASQAKSQLLATISHEIRTPMNGVLGMAELLATTKLDAQQREYLDTINDSGNLLLTIINDVLDYSKLEAGKLLLCQSATNVRHSFDRVIALLKESLRPDVEMVLQHSEDFPEWVMLDDHRFRQVVINLVGNSIKFTERGQIDIRYGLVNENVWFFSVSDTGVGIDEELLQRLFDPFEQSLNAISKLEQKGTGLGLSICQELTVLMGGSMCVESDVGKGTTMRVELPLRVAAENPPDNNINVNIDADFLSGLRVLVAEDNQVNRKVITALLDKFQIQPDIATDGQQAIDLFVGARGEYDLILMDCEMPVVDGFTAARFIRETDFANEKLAIVALTAHAMEESKEKANLAGMNYYLTKPVRLMEIKNLFHDLYLQSK